VSVPVRFSIRAETRPLERVNESAVSNIASSTVEPIRCAGGVPYVSTEAAKPCDAGWRASALNEDKDGLERGVVAQASGNAREREIGQIAVEVA